MQLEKQMEIVLDKCISSTAEQRPTACFSHSFIQKFVKLTGESSFLNAHVVNYHTQKFNLALISHNCYKKWKQTM